MPASLLTRLINKVTRSARLAAKDTASTLPTLADWDTRVLADVAGKAVVFVAGVQRSGTNMMMDILERSYHTDVFHESDPRAYHEFEMRSPDVVRRLVEASKHPHVCLKALCELQDLLHLLDEFAPARALWMLRRFPDVVNSHIVLWHKTPYFVGEIVKDRNGAAWRGRGMSDATLALVRELYHPAISNASACALLWYFRNVLFFEQELDRDPRVQLVSYEALATNPQKESARVFEFLGIPFSPHVVSKVFDSSVGRRAEPEIEPRIRSVCEALTARFDALLT